MIERPSARLILLDPAARLFLFNVHDPGVFDPANPHSDPFWVMIGKFRRGRWREVAGPLLASRIWRWAATT